MSDKTIPQLSVDAVMLYNRITNSNPGDVILYSELNGIIGRSVQKGSGYGVMQTARRKAMNENNMVFSTIANVGIKRLHDSEIAQSGESVRKAIRRKAKAGIKTLSCVRDFDGLSKEDKLQHNTNMSMIGALYQFSSTNTVKKISNVVETTSSAIPVVKTLELFSK